MLGCIRGREKNQWALPPAHPPPATIIIYGSSVPEPRPINYLKFCATKHSTNGRLPNVIGLFFILGMWKHSIGIFWASGPSGCVVLTVPSISFLRLELIQ